MKEKYLPIGTVVIFKGCLRPVMIIGNLDIIIPYIVFVGPGSGQQTIVPHG